jgi:hypothetical protein
MPAELCLFVSSTFRDLQPERDALARQCFPQARQRFAQVGKALVEIDLRWGPRPRTSTATSTGSLRCARRR